MKEIIRLYEENRTEKPLFIFNVTMQNHAGYTEQFDNFTPQIHATQFQSQEMNTYLSLLQLSDEAFKELTDYFSQQEQKTIIVFLETINRKIVL